MCVQYSGDQLQIMLMAIEPGTSELDNHHQRPASCAVI